MAGDSTLPKERLEAYLAEKLSVPAVRVTRLTRVPGGASRETWLIDAEWRDAAGEPRQAAYVLRRDPPASLLETDRGLEHAFYTAFAGSEVPVPPVLWLERDPSVLGAPFFVMERVAGEASPRRLLAPPFVAHRELLGRRMYEILAAIHRFEWRGTAVESACQAPRPEECWRVELEHWERVIDREELSPQPIVRAAIRWLRRNPPPPPERVTVVHGDFRVGNFLVTPEGDITAVLDWEMAHLGDPLEDLAWSFNEAWEWARDGRKGGLIERDEALRVYESAFGRRVDRAALFWWEVFSSVKAQAIWLTAARTFQSGGSRELVLAFTAYWLGNFQDEILLRTMGRGS